MSTSSNGPVSHLPGQVFIARGDVCDDHPNKEATHRVCVEADSFGAEYSNKCDECYVAYVAAVEANRDAEEICEACGCMKAGVGPIRDPDEGMAGPVYYQCADCRKELMDYHAKHRADDDGYDEDEMPVMDEPPEDEDLDTDQIIEHVEDNDEAIDSDPK